MSVPEAARGLDKDGRAAGVFLSLHADQAAMLRQPQRDSPSLMHTMLDGVGDRALRILRRTATASFISAPWILFAAAVGIFLVGWWRTKLPHGLLLLGVTGLQLAILLSVDQLWARYFFAVVPLLILWAGAGAKRFGELAAGLAPAQAVGVRVHFERGVAAICVFALAGLAYLPVRGVGELSQAQDVTPKQVGSAIAADAVNRGVRGRPVIMGVGLASVYYAGGTMRYVPFAAEAPALSYVKAMRPSYLVLRASERRQAPYVDAWLSRGIPDACAEPMPGEWERAPDAARVWRWTCTTGS